MGHLAYSFMYQRAETPLPVALRLRHSTLRVLHKKRILELTPRHLAHVVHAAMRTRASTRALALTLALVRATVNSEIVHACFSFNI